MSQPEPLRFRPIDLTGVYVLVVDDYEDTRELFRSALEAFGAEVVTARSARDALTIMKTARVNAMVSDLAMPGEDGLWLVQQLRRLKSTQGGGIPAIAITAHRERYAVMAIAGIPPPCVDLSRRSCWTSQSPSSPGIARSDTMAFTRAVFIMVKASRALRAVTTCAPNASSAERKSSSVSS